MRRLFALAAVLGVGWFGVPLLAAQPTPLGVSSSPATGELAAAEAPQPGHALTGADLETWLDGYMANALKAEDTAGAMVAVVRDGQVLLQKGYGYADFEKQIPVNADTTMFRMGSVSKLFVWTAVMQLVDEGRIDLDRDINAYLDFTIPPRHGKPVTMRDLMTHTGGFEEWVRYLWFSDPKQIRPLGDALKLWVPKRIYDAGTTPAYSNYGAALAGYVVERVSGQNFDDYVEQHIFQPLGMDHSTFRQPLPERFQAEMSKGYTSAGGPPVPYEILNLAPAGSMASTAHDMARFMLAHLQDGQLGDARIMSAEAARTMHDTPRTLLPPLDRMMLGFYEDNMNGREVIGHDGDTHIFHTAVRLFPAENIGLFVSVNTGLGYKLRTQLLRDFADRYLPRLKPAPPQPGVDARTAARHAHQIAGHYDNSRGLQSSFLHILNLTGQTEVVANADGSISIAGNPKVWREVAPYLWRETHGDERLAAKVVDGRVTRFSIDSAAPYAVFLPTPWWQSSAWLLPAVKLAIGALALTALFWPAAALIRRRYHAPFALAGREAMAYRLSGAAAIAMLALLATLIGTGDTMLGDDSRLWQANDAWLWTLQIMTLAVLLGASAIAIWNAWVVWTGKRGWPARLWSIVLILAVGAGVWAAGAFNLIAFSVNF